MPSVTVRLVYTPRPAGDRVVVPLRAGNAVVRYDAEEGVTVYNDGGDGCDLSMLTPAETLDLARAMALVAGCADPHWRGFHWRAEEANGNLLGETPLGEWYVDPRAAVQAIRTQFGTDSTVIFEGASGRVDKILRLPAGVVSSVAESDAIRAQVADTNPDEYPVASVEG